MYRAVLYRDIVSVYPFPRSLDRNQFLSQEQRTSAPLQRSETSSVINLADYMLITAYRLFNRLFNT